MGQPLALYLGANPYTGPACGANKCFIAAGYITTTINQGRRAGPMSSLLLLDVYEFDLKYFFKRHENLTFWLAHYFK